MTKNIFQKSCNVKNHDIFPKNHVIRGIPLKNTPHIRIPPLIVSRSSIRGVFLSGPPKAENFQDLEFQNDWNPFRNALKITPNPLKITVFDCVLKHKTAKFSRLRRALPTLINIAYYMWSPATSAKPSITLLVNASGTALTRVARSFYKRVPTLVKTPEVASARLLDCFANSRSAFLHSWKR